MKTFLLVLFASGLFILYGIASFADEASGKSPETLAKMRAGVVVMMIYRQGVCSYVSEGGTDNNFRITLITPPAPKTKTNLKPALTGYNRPLPPGVSTVTDYVSLGILRIVVNGQLLAEYRKLPPDPRTKLNPLMPPRKDMYEHLTDIMYNRGRVISKNGQFSINPDWGKQNAKP
jgi:hypothetical protein